MAIKFVDKEPEEPKAKRSAPKPEIKPDEGIPNQAIEPELPRREPRPPAGIPQGQLPFAKADPKSRGRKKPLK